jgi:hypothetical protein
VIAVRQIVKLDGEVVEDELISLPSNEVCRLAGYATIEAPFIHGKHEVSVSFEFDSPLVVAE